MSDKPTVQAMLADENLLRREIGRVLNPKPWNHDPKCGLNCAKCGIRYWTGSLRRTKESASPCPIPDAFAGPLEVAAERLVQRCGGPLWRKLQEAIYAVAHAVSTWPKNRTDAWRWFGMYATPTVRCAICLLALGACEIDPQPTGEPR